MSKSRQSGRPRRKKKHVKLRWQDEGYECEGMDDEPVEAETRKRKQATPKRGFTEERDDCEIDKEKELSLDQREMHNAEGNASELDDSNNTQPRLPAGIEVSVSLADMSDMSTICQVIQPTDNGLHCHCELAQSLHSFQLLISDQLISFEKEIGTRLSKFEKLLKAQTLQQTQLLSTMTTKQPEVKVESQQFAAAPTDLPAIVPGSVLGQQQVDLGYQQCGSPPIGLRSPPPPPFQVDLGYQQCGSPPIGLLSPPPPPFPLPPPFAHPPASNFLPRGCYMGPATAMPPPARGQSVLGGFAGQKFWL